MAFDQNTRNRLQRFVSEARSLLTGEFMRQLQGDYGMDLATGGITDIEMLKHLDDMHRQTARLLRDSIAHYVAASPSEGTKEALERIIREQAFTILNRLCALRMAEARGIVIETIGNGYNSKGFQLYSRLAGNALGETGDAYRCYLFSLFDELATDLAALFDRYSPMGRLFPSESTFLKLLELINHSDLATLWSEDETIGWIYQYFNTKEEREGMRKASQAPRNSRELAVRNQFFTPRYVVEFLTDNTLGRIWYEMTRGKTRLTEKCSYLVHRPHEIFLGDPVQAHERIWGKQEDEGIDVPEIVKKAFHGNLEDLPKYIGPETNWIALAIPPDQFEPYTGIPYEPFDSGPLNAIRDALEGKGDKEVLDDVTWLWMALCEFRLTDSGSPYGYEPFEKLWNLFLDAVEKKTNRAEKLQEELVKEPIYIPYRSLKDPRMITMLDPACGSMHFGIYAFDLYETIYEEAWDNYSEIFADIREQVSNKNDFMNMVPEMIIRYNIHGIDIDPRACQIAELSLWLRAQKSYQQLKIKAADRPRITKSNIVCAEPMPGEKELLEEFISKLKPTVLGDLMREVWEKMQLAGEAGSLLKIEEELKTTIDNAKKEWERYKAGDFDVAPVLFKEMEQPVQGRMRFDVIGVKKKEFWDQAETLVLRALREFAESATNGHMYQRKLFAEDAVQGFAFINLCRKKFDVVLMNPPFGDLPENSIEYLRSRFPILSENLYCGFLMRASDLGSSDALVGAITDRSYLIKQSYEGFRNVLIEGKRPVCVVDLGWGVLDANVETCAVILRNSFDVTLFADLGNKGMMQDQSLRDLIQDKEKWIVERLETFRNIPFTAFAYSMPPWVRKAYANGANRLDRSLCHAVRGMAGADSDRLYRAIVEIDPRNVGKNKSWIILQKGSPYSPFYYPPEYLLLHDSDTFKNVLSFEAGRVTGREDYGRRGLSFGKRTELMYAFIMNAGQVFSVEGQAIFPNRDDLLWQSVAIINSSPFQVATNAICGQHKLHGYVNAVHIASSLVRDCSASAKRIYLNLREIDTCNELSLIFCLPLVLSNRSESKLAEAITATLSERTNLLTECRSIHKDINSHVIEDLGAPMELAEEGLATNYIRNLFGHDGLPSDECHSLFSWTVGVAFGRWDVRIALGQWHKLDLPDIDDPLPACPPGMLISPDGLPATTGNIISDEWLRARPNYVTLPPERTVKQPTIPDSDYPIKITWDGIIVDDVTNQYDIINYVREVLEVLWRAQADVIEQEACEILNVKSLRDYFRKSSGFFADHLKRYSKSRRQAPIYWPLSTASGSYTLWLYCHRLTDQTLYICINDFVEPKIKQVIERVTDLRRKTNRSKTEEKDLETLTDLSLELEDFRDELLHIAKFWKPNLNDGVQITAAPLWNLFRLSKWQATLKNTWKRLEKGDYDWAHLAYSIWPDRVREVCKKNLSIAIAHSLEALCEVKPKISAEKANKKEPEYEEKVDFSDMLVKSRNKIKRKGKTKAKDSGDHALDKMGLL